MGCDPVHFSAMTVHWPTPRSLYQALNTEFSFDLDPCPLDAKEDGLTMSWKGRRVFCNPPYGPGIRPFLDKAHEADVAVFLIPARTDVLWFHEVVLPGAREIRFIKGRLRFGDGKGRATFPSMICVFVNKPCP